MIKTIYDLTMTQYVDIACGDMGLFGDIPTEDAERLRRNLLFEFRKIADPGGMSAFLTSQKSKLDEKTTLLLFQICSSLLNIGEWETVRTLLSEYGLNAKRMSYKQVKAETERRLKRAKSHVDKSAKEAEESTEEEITAEQIRLNFDRQAAALMTYFKFQIDFDRIKASAFACMLDQADKEIKAKKSILARM